MPFHDPGPPCGELTILRTVGPNRVAAKTFACQADGSFASTASYSAGLYVEPRSQPFAGTHGLHQALEALAPDPKVFIVRGGLTAEFHDRKRRGQLAGSFTRRTRDHGDGAIPTLEDRPSILLPLDSDDWPIPEGLAIERDAPEIANRFIREKLPAEFHTAACVVQLSSSAGLLPGAKFKAHLFFLADRPVPRLPLESYLAAVAPKAEGGVDPAVLRPAQPIYTAAPILLPAGTPDPLAGRRIFLLPGARETVSLLPDAEMQRVAEEARAGAGKPRKAGTASRSGRKAAKARSAPAVADLAGARTPEAALALMGDGPGFGGFHGPLTRALWLFALGDASQDRDGQAVPGFLDTVAAAIAAAPRGPHRDLSEYDRAYLDRSLRGAFDKARTAARKARAEAAAKGRRRLPAADARALLAAGIGLALAEARGWWIERSGPPPRLGFAVTTGVGKTDAIVRALRDHRAMAEALGTPPRVLIFAPTHRLAAELAARLKAEGVKAAAWRGLDAEDPDAPLGDDGKPTRRMCLEPAATEAALKAGRPVRAAACGGGRGQPACQSRDICGWQRQREGIAGADVVVMASAAAFHQLPAEARRGVGLAVFDEAFWQAGLASEAATVDEIADGGRDLPVLTRGKPDLQATAILRHREAQLARVLRAAALGQPLDVGALRRAGLTPWSCRDAIALTWRRVPKGSPVRPGMTREERAAALAGPGATAAHLARRMALLWQALAEALAADDAMTARVVPTMHTGDSGEVRVVQLHLRRRLASPIGDVPVVVLDATLPTDIARHWLPGLTVEEVHADAPHQRVTLIPGPWGKTSLLPSDAVAPDEARRRQARIAELRDTVVALARSGPGLVVTYLGLAPSFAGIEGVDVANFNAIAGRDIWGGVRWLVVVGQPTPRPEDVGALIARITGKAPSLDSGSVLAGVEVRERGFGLLPVRRYADATAEAVRAAVADAELIQAIGRARGVNRTAENPVDVVVFANAAPAGLVVDSIRPWAEVQPCAVDRMALRGLVVESPADARRVWADLFPSIAAAKKAWQRWKEGQDAPDGGGGGVPARQMGTFPYEGISIGECPHLARFAASTTARPGDLLPVVYRPDAPRSGARRAWIAPSLLPVARQQIEAALGPLARWEPPGAATAPTRSRRRSPAPRRAEPPPPAAGEADAR